MDGDELEHLEWGWDDQRFRIEIDSLSADEFTLTDARSSFAPSQSTFDPVTLNYISIGVMAVKTISIW